MKIRLIILPFLVLSYIYLPHYTYAQPTTDTRQSNTASPETASSEAEGENDKQQKMNEVQDASDKIDQHNMDQMSDNN